MPAGGQFGGSRGPPVRPPERGVFPLDHFDECGAHTKKFLACLKENQGRSDAGPCRKLVRAYLDCRMQNGLMAKEELGDLGLGDDTNDDKGVKTAGPSTK